MAVFFHLRLLCSGIKESYIVLWYFQFLSHCSIAMCSCVRSRASVPYGPCSRPATLLYCENVSWYVSVYLILSFNLVLCIFHGFNLMLGLTTSKARPFSKTSHRPCGMVLPLSVCFEQCVSMLCFWYPLLRHKALFKDVSHTGWAIWHAAATLPQNTHFMSDRVRCSSDFDFWIKHLLC